MLRCNLLPCTSASVFSKTNNGKVRAGSQPEKSEEKIVDLKRIAGLGPLATVHMAVEMSYEADRAYTIGKITLGENNQIKQFIDSFVEGTRNYLYIPW